MYCIRDRVQSVDSLALKRISFERHLAGCVVVVVVVVVVVGVKGVIEAVDLRGAILYIYIFTVRLYS